MMDPVSRNETIVDAREQSAPFRNSIERWTGAISTLMAGLEHQAAWQEHLTKGRYVNGNGKNRRN